MHKTRIAPGRPGRPKLLRAGWTKSVLADAKLKMSPERGGKNEEEEEEEEDREGRRRMRGWRGSLKKMKEKVALPDGPLSSWKEKTIGRLGSKRVPQGTRV